MALIPLYEAGAKITKKALDRQNAKVSQYFALSDWYNQNSQNEGSLLRPAIVPVSGKDNFFGDQLVVSQCIYHIHP